MTTILILAALIEEMSGNIVPDRELDRLRRIAEQRALATGHDDLSGYVAWLRDSVPAGEWRVLLGCMTVNESHLFRGHQQFRALANVVIPELAARRQVQRLRLWCAGCARGEEAATLAITLTECRHLDGWDWQILATDVDEGVLEEARQGRYRDRAVSMMPKDLLTRYFSRVDDLWELTGELRSRIQYRPLNLVRRPLPIVDRSCDVVFLRNVLIYFGLAAQQTVVLDVATALAADGALFVGPSESLRHLATPLAPYDLGDCFCYRPWVTGATPTESEHPQHSPAPRSPDSLGTQDSRSTADRVCQLVEAGRLDQALEAAAGAVVRSPNDPTLRAVKGRLHELAGSLEPAVAAYRAALYLDPGLHQVRFLMADCLARLGNAERAARELRAVRLDLAACRPRGVSELERLGTPPPHDIDRRCRSVMSRLGTVAREQ